MKKFEFLNNFNDAVCAFSKEGKIVFQNSRFNLIFKQYNSFERFKNHFNFNLCFLSSENIKNLSPLDLLIQSEENFHTTCTFQNLKEEYINYYIYTFMTDGYKIAIFKDITAIDNLDRDRELQAKYNRLKEENDKFLKLQEHAQAQVLKMGIINRISLLIRETNDITTILSCALEEIHNLIGAYETYFSVKEKNGFCIKYSVSKKEKTNEEFTLYEEEILKEIKNKNIIVSTCIKEYLNSTTILPRRVTRIIIPVYNKTKLLGIIVTLTKQKFQIEDNREILQSISVQLSSSIIQAGLIQQLNKKNKKLEKALTELKETQLQLINTEKNH